MKEPTQFLRMPKVVYDEARTLGLDRTELGSPSRHRPGALPVDGALVSLMGLLGLRVTERAAPASKTTPVPSAAIGCFG